MDQEKYLVESEFIFSSYNPLKLIKGMTFINKVSSCLFEPEFKFFTLEETPEDEEIFKQSFGAPVVVNIISTGDDGEIIALQDEIGYFDNEDNLILITEEQINIILNQYDGKMNIECDETGDPILYEGKVIISYLSDFDN